MYITNGSTLIVQHVRTREKFHFIVGEIIEYRAAHVLYGEGAAHEIWVPATHGRVLIPARASVLALLLKEKAAPLLRFIEAAKGLPWVVQDGEKGYPVLNMERLAGVHPGLGKEAMLKRAFGTVDLFQEWKGLGEHFPVWFIEARAKAKTDLWKPGQA